MHLPLSITISRNKKERIKRGKKEGKRVPIGRPLNRYRCMSELSIIRIRSPTSSWCWSRKWWRCDGPGFYYGKRCSSPKPFILQIASRAVVEISSEISRAPKKCIYSACLLSARLLVCMQCVWERFREFVTPSAPFPPAYSKTPINFKSFVHRSKICILCLEIACPKHVLLISFSRDS